MPARVIKNWEKRVFFYFCGNIIQQNHHHVPGRNTGLMLSMIIYLHVDVLFVLALLILLYTEIYSFSLILRNCIALTNASWSTCPGFIFLQIHMLSSKIHLFANSQDSGYKSSNYTLYRHHKIVKHGHKINSHFETPARLSIYHFIIYGMHGASCLLFMVNMSRWWSFGTDRRRQVEDEKAIEVMIIAPKLFMTFFFQNSGSFLSQLNLRIQNAK